MTGQTIRLVGPTQRRHAKTMIDAAPDAAVVNIREATRTTDQNAKMWAMLSDVSRSKPEGICQNSDMWKAVFMNACGHEVQFVNGLDGQPFPTGFRTSRLSKSQFSELIEFIYEYGSRHGVVWSENYGSEA